MIQRIIGKEKRINEIKETEEPKKKLEAKTREKGRRRGIWKRDL